MQQVLIVPYALPLNVLETWCAHIRDTLFHVLGGGVCARMA